jgi:hypothetical protein
VSRGPCTFKQRDVRRAIKAAKAEGLHVVAILTDGTVVTSDKPTELVPLVPDEANEWDDLYSARLRS